jgi:hypothetical protein
MIMFETQSCQGLLPGETWKKHSAVYIWPFQRKF